MSSSSSSDILSTLPLLPLKLIIDKLTVQDIVNLSFEIESLTEFIRYIGLHSGDYSVTFDEFGLQIQMLNQDFSYHWYGSNPEDVLNVFDEKFNHIVEAFSGEINRLNVCPITIANHLDRLPKVCNVLSITRKGDHFTDLDSLLNQINFKKALFLTEPIYNEKVFSVDLLRVNNSGLIDSTILHRLQNKYIQLEGSSLSEDDVNHFLHNFKMGKANKKLHVMTIQKEDGWSVERVVKGLGAIVTEQQVYEMDSGLLKFFGDRTYQNGKFLYDTQDFVMVDATKVSVDEMFSTLRIHVWHKGSIGNITKRQSSGELRQRQRDDD